MKHRRSILSALPAFLLLSGWREQEAGDLKNERAYQNNLPRSRDPVWPKLRACKVSFSRKSGLYSLTPTPDVKAMAGKPVKIKGFILPLDGLDMTRHFLLGVNTPVCLFHPPGEPNEVIEVRSVRPVRWTETQVTIEGQFGLIRNAEMGVFFSLTQAKQVKA
ncbi:MULTISPECIES: DUF3299 domain-containing protein [Asticcacaulis]|uniref:DUF3299 domain-containing protein n=1 Tax=Asticcacaulis TaxID=76890 RepID=UPI001AE9DC65|nr:MULTISPECIES: DUF3299 domain-containing protein [Asticcacaulis]MBP2160310.1 hypothetical protein [Asticcacaulis solisilvae]MDR6801387.1 hypothetical protein [Asticcacaulis sp. BE141]